MGLYGSWWTSISPDWWHSITLTVVAVIFVNQIVRLFNATSAPAAPSASPAAAVSRRVQGRQMELSQFAQHSLLFLQLQRQPRLKRLPQHLIATIYQMAGVFIITTRRVNNGQQVTNGDAVCIEYTLPTQPPPRQVRPTFMPIKVRVVVTSRDQGWSSYPGEHGTRSSHTWGVLRLLPPTGDAELASVEAYRNIHAGAAWEEHTRELDLSSDLLRELRACVIARREATHKLQLRLSARYPGWVNRTNAARIEVVWALEGFENLFSLQ